MTRTVRDEVNSRADAAIKRELSHDHSDPPPVKTIREVPRRQGANNTNGAT